MSFYTNISVKFVYQLSHSFPDEHNYTEVFLVPSQRAPLIFINKKENRCMVMNEVCENKMSMYNINGPLLYS